MHSGASRQRCINCAVRALSEHVSSSCREALLLRETQAGPPEFSFSCLEMPPTTPGSGWGEGGAGGSWSSRLYLSIKPKRHSPGPPTVGTTGEVCGIWNKRQALCKPRVHATQRYDITRYCQVTYFVMSETVFVGLKYLEAAGEKVSR